MRNLLVLFLALLALGDSATAQTRSAPSKAEIERMISSGVAQVRADMAMVNKVRPGLGDDEGRPEVAPLLLPAGVRIDGGAMGIDADPTGDVTECKEADVVAGTGDAVKSCSTFCGNGGQISLPPGMMITSDTGEGQNGLLVEDVYFTVPPALCTGGIKKGETAEELRRKFIVQLNLYCLNESKSPSFAGMTYKLAGVTKDPDLLALVTLLQRKKIQSDEHREIVQEAIYAITEGRGLTSDVRGKLNKLPNKA